jgi:hypothetical protein
MDAALKLVAESVAEGGAPEPSQRECRRSRVMLSASMRTGAADVAVLIRDVSASGAMITTPVSPAVGSYVTLRRDPVCVHAQVVWRDGKKVGLQFRDRIDEESLMISLRAAITRQ